MYLDVIIFVVDFTFKKRRRIMKNQYMVKIKTNKNSTSTVTTQISANTAAEAKAEAKKHYPNGIVISCVQK